MSKTPLPPSPHLSFFSSLPHQFSTTAGTAPAISLPPSLSLSLFTSTSRREALSSLPTRAPATFLPFLSTLQSNLKLSQQKQANQPLNQDSIYKYKFPIKWINPKFRIWGKRTASPSLFICNRCGVLFIKEKVAF